MSLALNCQACKGHWGHYARKKNTGINLLVSIDINALMLKQNSAVFPPSQSVQALPELHLQACTCTPSLLCILLTLKSISKQAGSLDTFLCHLNSWNTRCGRVLALQKVYKNLFSLFLSPVVWGKEKKIYSSEIWQFYSLWLNQWMTSNSVVLIKLLQE